MRARLASCVTGGRITHLATTTGPAENGAAGPFLTNGRNPEISLDIQLPREYDEQITRLDMNLIRSRKGLMIVSEAHIPCGRAPAPPGAMAPNKPNSGGRDGRDCGLGSVRLRSGWLAPISDWGFKAARGAQFAIRRCQTNPIRELYRPGIQGMARQTNPISTAPAWHDPTAPNKPNFSPDRRQGRTRSRQTNPIWPGHARPGNPKLESRDEFDRWE